MQDMMRLMNLRVLAANVEAGTLRPRELDAARDHYGLPFEATVADILESIKDDAAACAERMMEAAK